MLKTRVATALCLASGFIGALFMLPVWANATLFLVIPLLGGREWGGLMALDAYRRTVIGVQMGLFCLVLFWCDILPLISTQVLFVSCLFWLLVSPLWLFKRWSLNNPLLGLLTGWVVIVPTWIAMVYLLQRSPWLLLVAMALIWVADIAAYFCGRTFGRHKLAPTISPGKTREGALGALLAVLLYGYAVVRLGVPGIPFEWSPWFLVFLGLLTVSSIVGDLFESLLKRQVGLKDSGDLLPGHGGILDRIDSQTSTLPLVAFFISLVSV